MRKRVYLSLILAVLLFAGCGQIQQYFTKVKDDASQIFTMGTVFEIRVISEEPRTVISDIEQSLYETDKKISFRNDQSVSAMFNKKQAADVSEIDDLIQIMLEIAEKSEGAFDPTVLPISELWQFDKMSESDFELSSMNVPSKELINEKLQLVDYQYLQYNKESGILSSDLEEQQIELGAIGKGYAIEKAKDILENADVTGAMISAGSSIYVYGAKADQTTYKIGMRNPRGTEQDYIGILNVTDCTISTSGDYERYFEMDGHRYHHIIDPRTGYPAENELMQVTIISDNSTLGDALSTACFVLGLDQGMKLAKEYNVLAIFIDRNKNVWYNSSDVLNVLQFLGEDSGYTLHEYNQGT